ncbi:class I SAM-dependent methyltransferase [Kribbella sandramycini]|uniref:Class I SAM-dependent methyltransferase n=1 Tax=Kribbella sandramycini TaxID=60450 RepID=A0A7Y4L7K0_9ACTN|nr:class I SAM-dependent methyltransferase [Kribbella sandramycini]MBB6570248.1 O-methyltransferase involved in polyketide biosynthesis [Kribbella sandramycini]NOL45833.1 class I SAM-dependent methyltransferase [Kribbella sandramycini]
MRVQLGATQETLLIPLYGRAVETRKKRPMVADPKAVEMVEAIDYDFGKFDGGRSLAGSVLRGMIFDHHVAQFLSDHPGGTVVEIGAGLNTRFDRLDNGRCHWIDLDLPDSMELRRQFFTPSARNQQVAGSVLDTDWLEIVEQHPGPYFFIAEAVFLYLQEDDVRGVVEQLGSTFRGSRIAFDTAGKAMVATQRSHDALKHLAAKFDWECDDPRTLEPWGLRLLDSRTLAQQPAPARKQIPLPLRLLLPIAGLSSRAKTYRMNLFTLR